MTVDDTLEHIDVTLDGYVSDDAMRWRPDDMPYEPVVEGPARYGGVRILTDVCGWDGYAAVAAMAPYGEVGRADLQAVLDTFAAFATLGRAVIAAARPIVEAWERMGERVRAGIVAEVARRQLEVEQQLRERTPSTLMSRLMISDGLPASHAAQLEELVEQTLRDRRDRTVHPFAVRPERERRR